MSEQFTQIVDQRIKEINKRLEEIERSLNIAENVGWGDGTGDNSGVILELENEQKKLEIELNQLKK